MDRTVCGTVCERFVRFVGIPTGIVHLWYELQAPPHAERFVRFADFPAWVARFVERFVNSFHGLREFRCESFTSELVYGFPSMNHLLVERFANGL